MDTKRISIPVLLLVSVVGTALSQSRPACPKNQVLHSNDRCCQYIRCDPQYYVKVCDTEGGADVCVPCGPTVYLDDPTDSNFVFDCLEKNCGEDTEPIDFPATKFDVSACSKRCRCNPAKNYCETDPCRCQYTLCSQGETLLQNCTCVRESEVLSSPSATTQEVRVSEPPPVVHTGKSLPDVTDSDPGTVDIEKKEDGGKTSVGMPAFTDVPGMVPRSEDTNWWLPGLVLVFFVLIVVFIVFDAVYISPRRENNVTYSSINFNNSNTFHNYKSNVQIGDKNTQKVHESVSENESAASTDED